MLSRKSQQIEDLRRQLEEARAARLAAEEILERAGGRDASHVQRPSETSTANARPSSGRSTAGGRLSAERSRKSSTPSSRRGTILRRSSSRRRR